MKISTKSLTAFFGLFLVMSMALSSTAYAIQNGQPDEDAHPYVCWVVTWDGTSPFVYLGTGSLIAPDVVLTAGHVTNDAGGASIVKVWVSFSPIASWPLPEFGGTGNDSINASEWHTHPDYAIGASPTLKDWITHDVGLVILDETVILSEYAVLPDPGFVDTLPMTTDLDLVGYGVQYQVRGGGPPFWWWIDFGYRYNATAQLIASKDALSDDFFRTTANPAKGKGGTCFGDSGGPILLADTNTVLGVCSWGTNGNCAGLGYQQRIDTNVILDWIDGFMP